MRRVRADIGAVVPAALAFVVLRCGYVDALLGIRVDLDDSGRRRDQHKLQIVVEVRECVVSGASRTDRR